MAIANTRLFYYSGTFYSIQLWHIKFKLTRRLTCSTSSLLTVRSYNFANLSALIFCACAKNIQQDFLLNIIQAPVNIIILPVNIFQVSEVPTNIIQALTNIISVTHSKERTPAHWNLGGNQQDPSAVYFHPSWVNNVT